MLLWRRRSVSRLYKLLTLARKVPQFEKIYQYKSRERRISLGNENSDKTFYIIRRASGIEGICSMLNSVLGHLAFAEKKGYIPIVDMQTYYNCLWQPEERRKKENAWEYYFRQPAGYSLCDIQKSKNIILSNSFNAPSLPSHDSIYKKKKEIEMWNRIFDKYIHLRPQIEKRIDEHWEKINLTNEKVMGICLRMGITYASMKDSTLYEGYTKPPTLEQMIEKTESFMKTWDCKKVFLVIDDSESAKKFKKHFGDRLILLKRNRSHFFENGVPLDKVYRDSPFVGKMIWKDNIDYIKEIFFLSRCNCILSAKTSGTATAYIINGNSFENEAVVGSNIL